MASQYIWPLSTMVVWLQAFPTGFAKTPFLLIWPYPVNNVFHVSVSCQCIPCQALPFAHATFHIISTSAFPTSWLFQKSSFLSELKCISSPLFVDLMHPQAFKMPAENYDISASVGVPINSVIELNWCTQSLAGKRGCSQPNVHSCTVSSRIQKQFWLSVTSYYHIFKLSWNQQSLNPSLPSLADCQASNLCEVHLPND